ncbi:DEKNAAC100350 [Brettanomyces naardenensis]|uniref:DEKNAAC100350 n=1 Tax=Brettanomyces naardenensis TaxID=13370 RepID=A0A448YEE8_BRENA|nr:DEKNAAC100350 [Brettanomyces naardenensis]
MSPLRDSNFLESALSPSGIDRRGNIRKDDAIDEDTNSDTVNNVSDNNTTETEFDADLQRLERSYADSIIKNKDLIRQQERLNVDMREKQRQVDAKTLRINELLQENTALMAQLRRERDLNEQEFNSWSEMKAQLESKVQTLKEKIRKSSKDPSLHQRSASSLSMGSDTATASLTDRLRREVEKLKKRVLILAKENELEVHSKMLIIDELEMFKERWNELDAKYKTLKADYDGLVEEFGGELRDGDEEEIVAPSRIPSSMNGDPSLAEELERMVTPLHIPKQRERGSRKTSSVRTISIPRSPSLRVSSLSKFINDVELQAQEERHSQETMKLDFQIRSLELQNEKLHSYIGFVLQQLHHRTSSNSFEYSDEVNIKSAKKSLKKVLRSASAYPIRPSTLEMQIQQPKRQHMRAASYASGRRSTQTSRRSHNGFIGATGELGHIRYSELASSEGDESMSSDYMGGKVECVDLGGSEDSSDGGDEVELREAPAKYDADDKGYDDSLSVSFKMDFTPSLNLKKRKKSKLFKRSPASQIEKISAFNMSAKSSVHSLRQQAGLAEDESAQKVGVKEEDEQEDEKSLVQRVQIEEGKSEDEVEDDFDRSNVLDEVSDYISDDVSDGESVSLEEVNRFRIVLLRRLFCPRHSTFQCFCGHDGSLVDPEHFYLAASPVAALRRSLKNHRERKHGAGVRRARQDLEEIFSDAEYEADESDSGELAESDMNEVD